MKQAWLRDVVVVAAGVLIAAAVIKMPGWLSRTGHEFKGQSVEARSREVNRLTGCIPTGAALTVPRSAPYEVQLPARTSNDPEPDYASHLVLRDEAGNALVRDPLPVRERGHFSVSGNKVAFAAGDAGRVLMVGDSDTLCR